MTRMQRNLSREAHLWYTITSPEYMTKARDALQDAFDFLLLQLGHVPEAADYPPLTYWGDKMKSLLDEFDSDLAMLKHGNFQPMIGWEGQLGSIPRGFDEGVRWMPDHDGFAQKLNTPVSIAGAFWRALTMSQMFTHDGYKDGTADWRLEIPEDMGIAGDDIAKYYEAEVFPTPPEQIPEYAPDTAVACATGEIVPWTGVWVPGTGLGTAALAFARQGIQIMQPAYEVVRVDEESGDIEEFNVVECTWHPVRLTGRMIPNPARQASTREDLSRLRCEADQPCPREGFWFTPASAGSRRHFKYGEMLPEFKSDYGLTIWQWDDNQA
jgi:hypothetical protein